MGVRVGISGWTYPSWRGDFYPPDLPHEDELAYVADRLTTVELNASFYSLQRPSSYAAWRAELPDDFVLAVKGGRYLTHSKRLKDVETPLADFLASGVLGLGPVLGPLLWQLPERLVFDEHEVGHFLSILPRTTAAAAALARQHDDLVPAPSTDADEDRPLLHALEFRHHSFCDPRALELLRQHGVAAVVADSDGRWPHTVDVTATFVYVRLHGDIELYANGYSDDALDRWAEKCLGWAESGLDVLVYFDNDAHGRAPHDAVRLLERVSS